MAAPFWVDAFSRGMDAGDTLGDRFSQWNAGRKAKNLREELEGIDDEVERQRRADAGFDEIEAGPMRRGISLGLRDAYNESRAREIGRQSYEQREAGDYESAYGTEADYAGARGDLPTAQRGLDMRQQVRGLRGAQSADAMTGSARPDYSRYEAGQESYYAGQGRADAAQQAGENASTWRMKEAGEQAGLVFNELQQDTPDANVIAAYGSNLARALPEVFGRDPNTSGLRLDGSTLHVFRDGKAVSSFDLKNAAEKNELMSMLTRYQKNPAAALNEAYQSQLKAAEEAREHQRGMEKIGVQGMADVAQEAAKPDDYGSLISNFSRGFNDAGSDEKGSVGIKSVAQIGPDAVHLLSIDGTPYTAKLVTKDAQGNVLPEGKVVIYDTYGKEVQDFSRGQRQFLQNGFADLVGALSAGRDRRIADAYDVVASIAGGKPRGPARRGPGEGAASAGTSDKRGSLPTDAEYQRVIVEAAKRHGVPPAALLALAQQESGYGANMTNDETGAAGHFQYIPDTAKRVGLKDPYDLAESADAAARDMAERMKAGGIEEAFASHFAGPGGGNRKERTAQYVADVSQRMRDIEALLGGGEPEAEAGAAAEPTAEEKPTAAAKPKAKVSDASTEAPPETPLSRAGKVAAKASASASAAAKELRAAEAALERFDREVKVPDSPMSLLTPGAAGAVTEPAQRSVQREARNQLVDNYNRALEKVEAATAGAGKAARQTRRQSDEAEAAALARRYIEPGKGGPVTRK